MFPTDLSSAQLKTNKAFVESMFFGKPINISILRGHHYILRVSILESYPFYYFQSHYYQVPQFRLQLFGYFLKFPFYCRQQDKINPNCGDNILFLPSKSSTQNPPLALSPFGFQFYTNKISLPIVFAKSFFMIASAARFRLCTYPLRG